MDRMSQSPQEERDEVQREGDRDDTQLQEESDIRNALNDEAEEEPAQANVALARIEMGLTGVALSAVSLSVNSAWRLPTLPHA